MQLILFLERMQSNVENPQSPCGLEYHQEVILTITDVNNLGYGVGRVNNWVITVPFVDIGETAKVRIFRNHKNYSEADLVEIITPSAHRIEKKCQYFGICGGCQYQHITYARQLELKKKQVYDIFKRLAKTEVLVNDVIHGELEYGYRMKLTPHFEKPKTSKELKIGFLKNGTKRSLIDIEECPIASDKINTILPEVRQYVFDNRQAYNNGATLLLRDVNEGVATDQQDVVSQTVNNKTFFFKAGNFFQNNNAVLPKMVEYVISQVACAGINNLIDAYCGVGLFGIMSHEKFQNVTGIELSDDAIELAKKNADNNNARNISFIKGDAEKIFSAVTFKGEDTGVIIDPPRAGCSKEFIEQILEYGAARIVYVSCAPDTQARDYSLLEKKYKIINVQPIDLFPQTRHIENILTLVLR